MTLPSLSMVYTLLCEPFVQYAFLRKALIGCCALSLSCGPIGTFMVLRRMSLMGDALSHSLLPGIAIAFLISGFSIIGLSVGGVIAGLLMALTANWIQEKTSLSQDSTFAAFFLISMAFGLLILAIFGGHLDLMHVLLGTVLSLSKESLIWISVVSSVSLIVLTLIYRPLVLRSFDLPFFQSVGGNWQLIDVIFLTLITVNLVSAFQALGTLMALGLLLLPAITARLFARQIWTLALSAAFLGVGASYGGLLIAYHGSCPCGPAIILTGGFFYLCALISRLEGFKRWGASLGAGSAIFLLFSFFPTPLSRDSLKPHIVTSFTVLADFVREIAGNHVIITSLVGPNGDAHTYEPSPRDMITLLKADLVILNGLTLEGHWMDRLMKGVDFQGRSITATKGCRIRTLSMGQQIIPDPHAWQDVKNARIYIQNISHALQKLLPQKAQQVQQKATQYDKKLHQLDRWIHQAIQRIPASKRHVLTTHDGFGYFEQAYGIAFLFAFGLSTDVEPSPQALGQLFDHVRTQKIHVLFLENMINPQLLRQIAHETGLKVGGTLYSDALSPPHEPAATYLDMMRHNVTTLLQGVDESI